MPRSASMCQASSLFLRTRPMSLAPAILRPVLTIGAAAEVEEEDAGEAYTRLGRHGRFDVAVALLALHELDAGRRLLAVDGGAQPAKVLQEELARRGVAAQPEVLPGNVGKGFEL